MEYDAISKEQSTVKKSEQGKEPLVNIPADIYTKRIVYSEALLRSTSDWNDNGRKESEKRRCDVK